MKRSNKCPKCGSADVISHATAVDSNQPMGQFTVATFRKPDAILFKGRQASTISAWICADCGFVELYADSPKDLKLADG